MIPSTQVVVLAPEDLVALIRKEILPELVALAMDRPDPTALVDRRGLARELSCSLATIDRLTARGMPSIKVVDARRYSVTEVLSWLRSRVEVRSCES